MSRTTPDISVPSWLHKVAENYDQWQWLDQDASDKIAEEMNTRYLGRGPAFVPLQPQIVKLCHMLVGRLRAVATIPTTARRPDVVDHQATVFIEITDPKHMIVCVHHELPPLLWFPAGDTASQLREQMAPYATESSAPDVVHFPLHRRGFIGTPGILEMSRDELFAHWSTSPLAESLFWGSAFEKDPWPAKITEEEIPGLAEQAAYYLTQHQDGPWGISFRAIASRSVLCFEDMDGLWTLELHYEPAAHHDLIQALNAQFSQQWPLDLPVDVCALLIGMHFEEGDQILEFIQESSMVKGQEEELVFNLYAYASVMRNDLSAVETLRPFLSHFEPDVREAVVDIALRNNLDFMLLWFLAVEPQNSPLYHEVVARLS